MANQGVCKDAAMRVKTPPVLDATLQQIGWLESSAYSPHVVIEDTEHLRCVAILYT